ncbi:hypothetical protein [Kineosporia sp. A_224]|uniref:hypothetical protein n=1 Tax=Kineosporia sp. A_224 TaxID=1962180 RepID=UPI000B4AAB4D|nr:hypothetical protein [Kineosporia sp. A_224]
MRQRTWSGVVARTVAVLAVAAVAAVGPPAHAATPVATAAPGGNAAYRAALARPVLPASADPGLRGPYATRAGEYRLGDLEVRGVPLPVAMRALVVSPVGAPGRRPLALFAHGGFAPCYHLADGDVFLPEPDWPCPAGWAPVPSYRGFRQTQDLLASQGWITVSVDLTAVDGQSDTLEVSDSGAARAAVATAHLARWARWARSGASWRTAPAAVRAGPRPDLGTVFLVGHTTGADTVNRVATAAALDQGSRWTVKGQLVVAPRGSGRNPAPGVPVVVVLPSCDAEHLSEGQTFVDDARDVTHDGSLRSSVLVVGANVLWFNAEWTAGLGVVNARDDWFDTDDPTCRAGAPTRLTAARQRVVGAAYVAAAARATALRDPAALPVFDGSAVRLASVGRAVVLSHDLGGRRRTLVRPEVDASASAAGGPRLRVCDLQVSDATQSRRCGPRDFTGTLPHFEGGVFPGHGGPVGKAYEVRWTAATGSVAITPARPRSIERSDDLELRVVVPPAAPVTRFAVRLTDADGTAVTVGTATVSALPAAAAAKASDRSGTYWAQDVRLRLDRAALAAQGLDLRRVTGLRLLPRSTTGSVILLDAWGRDPGLAAAQRVPFVRVDLGRVTVAEGDGVRTVRLPVTVTGRLTTRARFWIGGDTFGGSLPAGLPRIVTIPAGARRLDVRVTLAGDRRDDFDLTGTTLFAQGLHDAVAGDWLGELAVRDDDPTPALTVTPSASAREGGTLRWTVSLQRPSDFELFVSARVVAPVGAGGAELTTADVPAAWLLEHGGRTAPARPVALSRFGVFLSATLQPGSTTATLEVPVRTDTTVEGTERLRLRISGDDEDFPGAQGVRGLPAGATLTATVTDAG